MRTLVESVIAFNGRVSYGCDNDGNSHDKKWLYMKKDGGYAQAGQVAVVMRNNGEIVDTELCKNRAAAYNYILKNVESEGILA